MNGDIRIYPTLNIQGSGKPMASPGKMIKKNHGAGLSTSSLWPGGHPEAQNLHWCLSTWQCFSASSLVPLKKQQNERAELNFQFMVLLYLYNWSPRLELHEDSKIAKKSVDPWPLCFAKSVFDHPVFSQVATCISFSVRLATIFWDM